DRGAVAGEDLYHIMIQNPTADPREVAIYASANPFLVYLPNGTPGVGEKLFNNFVGADQLVDKITLLGNATTTLTFAGRLNPNYLNQMGDREVEIRPATISLYTAEGGRPATQSDNRTEEKIFYLVDGADDSEFDGIIKFADTLG